MQNHPSQYVGQTLLFQKSDGNRFTLLVLEATDLAVFGIDVSMGQPFTHAWDLLRIAVVGTSAPYKILSAIPASHLLLGVCNYMRTELTQDYRAATLGHSSALDATTLLVRASLLELVNSIITKGLQSPPTPSSETVPDLDELIRQQTRTADSTEAIDFGSETEESENKTVVIQVPLQLSPQELKDGVYIYLRQPPLNS